MDNGHLRNPAYELREILREILASNESSVANAWLAVAKNRGRESPRLESMLAARLTLETIEAAEHLDIGLDAQALVAAIGEIFGPDSKGFRMGSTAPASFVAKWVIDTLTAYGGLMSLSTPKSDRFLDHIDGAIEDLDNQDFPIDVKDALLKDLEAIRKTAAEGGDVNATTQAAQSLAYTTLLVSARDGALGAQIRQWLGKHLAAFTLAGAALLSVPAVDALGLATGQEAIQVEVTQVVEMRPIMIEWEKPKAIEGDNSKSDEIVDAELVDESP